MSAFGESGHFLLETPRSPATPDCRHAEKDVRDIRGVTSLQNPDAHVRE
jgi:hypothetical protein